jgi:hypothetical protein
MSDLAGGENHQVNDGRDEKRDLTKRKRHLDKIARRGRRRVDNMVAGGAAGALVLSINFVDQLTRHPPSAHVNLLGAAWITLGIALFLSLSSSWAQAAAAEAAFDELDDIEDPEKLDEKWWESNWSKATPWLNVGAAILLLLGIGLLLIFAWLNITG